MYFILFVTWVLDVNLKYHTSKIEEIITCNYLKYLYALVASDIKFICMKQKINSDEKKTKQYKETESFYCLI